MGVTSAIMQGTDFASLYNRRPTYRKQTSSVPQTVISKATTHSHMLTHPDRISERTLISYFKYW